jgi:hypothetical protein
MWKFYILFGLVVVINCLRYVYEIWCGDMAVVWGFEVIIRWFWHEHNLSFSKEIILFFSMFGWSCISKYACNETSVMWYLSSVWVTTPLHVLGLLVARHQEAAMYLYMWQLVRVVRFSWLLVGLDGMEHTQKQNFTCGLYAHTMLHWTVSLYLLLQKGQLADLLRMHRSLQAYCAVHYTLVVCKICWLLKCLHYGLSSTHLCRGYTHLTGFKWLQWQENYKGWHNTGCTVELGFLN